MANTSSSHNASVLSESLLSQSSTYDDLSNVDQNQMVQPEMLPDMTVKEYLNKIEKEISERIMARAVEHNKRLFEEFEQKRDELLQEAKRIKTSSKPAAAAKVPTKVVTVNISGKGVENKKIDIKVGGPKNAVAKVGRSEAKTFVEKGISLPWDDEVSTTHGQFSLQGEEVLYTDMDSTNKSHVFQRSSKDMITLEGRESAIVRKGDTVHVGACALKIVEIKDSA